MCKTSQNSSLGKSDKCDKNFMHLDHQDNTFWIGQWQNYYLSLRNSGIYKTDGQKDILIE